MLENKLTFEELGSILRPFLRLDSPGIIRQGLESTLGIRIESREDIVCQNRLLVTFKGYRIDIRDIQVFEGRGLSLTMQFRAPAKWWHGWLRDQNSEVVNGLKRICQIEMDGLAFERFDTFGSSPLPAAACEGPLSLVFWHDSRALNAEWKQGRDVSPLLIAPDTHDEKCFIELMFNPLAYKRVGEKTQLRDDWMKYAFAISEGIEAVVRKVLGKEKT